MAARHSAGVLMYRRRNGRIEVLLVHAGGPYWQRKDEGAWSLPKGEFDEDEDAEAAARREFAEETGSRLTGTLVALPTIRQAGGKVIHPFAMAGDLDADAVRSNTFTLEWPPRSGRMHAFPEVDRAAWFTLDVAMRRILAGQRPVLAHLAALERAT
jgi:predicted NUDIX family NTP pyrophosphohydrolase